MADEPGGRSRRDLLRSLSGAGFLSSLVEACAPAPKRPATQSKNPATTKAVIPAGREAEVLALLGPLARQPFDGYKLEEATVASERIDFRFAGAGGKILISLVAIANVDAGVVHAYTRSFRVLVEGDAPDEARFAVVERVAAEVMEHDHGQLWVRADTAPRADGPK
jgi:hypothetical protein